MSESRSNGAGTERAGLGTSIVGLVFSLIGLFLINPFMLAGLAGVVFSIWGIVRSRRAATGGRTLTRVLAVLGIAIGALAILGWILNVVTPRG